MKEGSGFSDILFRRKQFKGNSHLDTKLKRCLSVIDVMFIAIGHMIGAGIYVLTGQVVHNQTGPSIVLSFLFSGIAALLSALSYAEFGARFPRAGSAYSYTYVAIGELWAFIIGWTVPLEYMIGNAAVARSWSSYFDTLFDQAIQNFTISTVGEFNVGGGFFSKYIDVLAAVLVILVAIAVAAGTKTSARINLIFVTLNIAILTFVIIANLTYADFSNWTGTTAEGISKFFPFGITGTLSGASTCFFAYIGFEALATAGEEAKNPHRTIPIATICSLGITFLIYMLMGASLTLMLPYNEINPDAAFAEAFRAKGNTVARYIMTAGALTGLINNLITGTFALTRASYAMADDGLIFAFLGKVNKFTKIPLNSVILFTILNVILVLFFDLAALVEFLSIGTLSAYSVVSACVVIMRYQPAPIPSDDPNKYEMDDGGSLYSWVPYRDFWQRQPAGRSINFAMAVLLVGYFWLAFTFRLEFFNTIPGYISLFFNVILLVVTFAFILGHKQNSLALSYKVPLLPFIPCLGLLINVFMMVYLAFMTWIRLFGWLVIGLGIYFGYGIWHSKERSKNKIVSTTAF